MTWLIGLKKFRLSMSVLAGMLAFHVSTGIAAIVTDDFNRCSLDTSLWTLVDPLGGASVSVEGVATNNARMVISVPPGVSRDPWIDNNHAVRVMQPAVDADFEIQAKFDSTVSLGYQMQGLMVEQDASRFLRLDINSDGNGAFLYCATFTPGAVETRLFNPVSNSTPIWLGFRRVGNQWTARYSTNGATWTDAATFGYSIAVAKVGVYAGNYSTTTAPAFTAKVDYFLNVASPFVGGEDSTPADPPTVLTHNVSGNGSISVNPDQSAYYCGPNVTVTATPAAGWVFQNWTGDLAGTNPQQTLAMTASRSIQAVFVLNTQPPTIGNIVVTPGTTGATVTWITNQPCSSRLDYGTNTSYELGAVTDAAYKTTHSMQLTGLTPETGHHCRITATNEGLQTSQSADLPFTTLAVPTGLISDDFNRCSLDTSVWTLVDPLGGASTSVEGVGTSNARLVISVPAGAPRDPWIDNNHAVRVMQPAVDANFEIQAKFDSSVSLGYQMQGLMVEQDASRFLRLDINSDGNAAFLYCATFTPGSVTTRSFNSIANSTPIWLGFKRVGSQWTARYSTNGIAWTDAATFSYSIAVAKVGVYAGNYSATTAPAFTAKVDYFLNVASPFVGGEDNAPADPPAVLTRSVSGNGTISVNPDKSAYYCGPTVTVTATPDAGWQFQNWTGDLTGTNPQQTLAMTVSRSIVAVFSQNSQPPPTIGNIAVTPTATGATVAWTTNQPSSSRIDYGKTTAYELGAVTDAAYKTTHSMQLTGLTPSTEYHCRITATNEGGQTSQSADLPFTTLSATTGLASDDFNTCTLNSALWTVVDPIGGSSVKTVGAGTGEAFLQISIPAGANHDMWTDGFNGVRAMRNAANTDFECTVKFTSLLNKTYQMQGLWVEQDGAGGIRYDMFLENGNLHLYSASFSDYSITERHIESVANANPMWLAIRRVGNQWTLRYSTNGMNWTDHTSFSHAMNVSKIGPWGGTYSMQLAPPLTMKVDYFANHIGPLPGDDDGVLPTTFLTRSVVGSGTITANPDRESYSCSESVTLTAIPAEGYTFQGWSGDVTGNTNPVTLQMIENRSVTATFVSGGGSLPVLEDANLSLTTARDGALLQVGYRISCTQAQALKLGCAMSGPYGETLTDDDHAPTIDVTPGDRWYYRDFRINLPLDASLGYYNVYWSIRRSDNVVLSREAIGYLQIVPTIPIRVPILMYHYFGPVAYDQYYWVYTDEFRRQMLALKAYGYTTMFMQELMDCRAGMATLPAKPVLITIDDGIQNQYTEMFPILMDPAINAKATSFIVTGDVGTISPPYSSLTWSEIQEMHDSGLVDIQSHTATHPYMSQLTIEQAVQELSNSRATIEAHLNKEARYICWPYGDYNWTAKYAASQTGYYGGLAVTDRVEPNCNDKWALRRVWIYTSTSVDYNPADPNSFFMTAIGDNDIAIPLIGLNSIAALNPTTHQPLDTAHMQRGTLVEISVQVTNNGPSADVTASLIIDADQQPANGTLLDTNSEGQDVSLTFGAGQRTLTWNWRVPDDAPLGQYYIQVSFHDQPYVLGWYYSTWQTVFTVSN